MATPSTVDNGANQGVNVAQENGVAITMGNGASGTGVQRVTIASDSTGQVALAAGSALAGGVNVVDSAGTNKLAVDASGNAAVKISAGTALVGIAQIGDGTTSSQKMAVDSSGNASVNIGKVGGVATQMAGSDGVTSANVLQIAQSAYNGATTDQLRTNINTAALITATGATTTQTGSDQTNYNGRGLIVVFDMTVNAGSAGSVTLTIQGKDAASGKYYTLLAGAAVTSVSTNVYYVYPGGPVTTNVAANAPLPRTWRVLATANNANPVTYTIGASVIL